MYRSVEPKPAHSARVASTDARSVALSTQWTVSLSHNANRQPPSDASERLLTSTLEVSHKLQSERAPRKTISRSRNLCPPAIAGPMSPCSWETIAFAKHTRPDATLPRASQRVTARPHVLR